MTRLIVTSVLGLGLIASASAQTMQILYAEPLALAIAPDNAQFEAYGRKFALSLGSNDRLLKGVPAARKAVFATARLLRGTINGAPGSWVRLATNGSDVSGAIWDGRDLYVVTRYDSIAPYLSNPLAATDRQAVVYRLSDTLNLLPTNFCATQPAATANAAPANGLRQFNALVNELKLQFVAAPTDEIDISLIADAALQQIYSSPNDNLNLAMLNTLNVVDGIYDAQVGLMINAADLRLVPPASDPFVSDDSHVLLGQLSTFRASIPQVLSRPIAHLLTGRTLDGGGTLGVARLSGACDANDGVSLTHVDPSGLGVQAALVMAHEIGHNLGASHDTAACGDTYLMWPEYSWRTTPVFSQCSLDQMRPFITAHRGSCIVSPEYGDVSARVGTIANPLRTEAFVWPVFVRSEGTSAALGATVNLDIQGVTINSVTPTQGACTPLNGSVSCQLGAIPAGTEVRVDLNLTTNYTGPLHLGANADAINDRYDTNNRATGMVDVQSLAILGMTISPSSATAIVGDTVAYRFTITSSGARDATNVHLELGGGAYFRISSAVPTQGSCTTSSCDLGNVPTGSSAEVVVYGHAIQGERISVSAQLSSANAYLTQQYVSAILDATAAFDLAIDVTPGTRIVAVGVPYDLVIPVRANGTRPVVGGLFRMNAGGATILSAAVDGTSCTSPVIAGLGSGCPLGTINPGQQKIVSVRMQFDTPISQTNVYVTADISDDELWSNNSANLLFQARVASDVSIGMSQSSGAAIERQNFQAVATLRSQGASDATNVAATLDVPVGVRILSGTLPNGTCTLTGDRHISCTRATLALTEQPQMTVTLVGDEPAQYVGNFAVTATNDAVSSNNALTLDLYVWPLTDVGLNPIPTLPGFIVGQSREFTVEVVTGSVRPAQNVVVDFPWSPSLTLEAISTPVGTCDISGTSPHCNLGDLPANSLIRVTPRYRALSAGSLLSGWIRVSALRDVDYNNNNRSVYMSTYEAGDMELRVASPSVTGTVGSTLALPHITLNATSRSNDILIDIPIPGFATVESASFAGGICTGTTTLQCYLSQREPGSSDVLDVTLRLNSSGTFTSDLRVHAANDVNPANDTASLQIQANAAAVTPPPTPPAPSPSGGAGGGAGGGGGGGRLEWFALSLLASLAGRRTLRIARR